MLALAEVEQGHDSGLLVLRGVALEDLGNDSLILGVELEGDVGVVVGGVAVLGTHNVSMKRVSIAHTIRGEADWVSRCCHRRGFD